MNAQSGCNDCHSGRSYAAGGFPFIGEPTRINKDNYLAGGVPFGPFVSANLTPHDDGKHAGLSFQGFKMVMRKGHDREDPPGDILQVMPWPVFAKHDRRRPAGDLRVHAGDTQGAARSLRGSRRADTVRLASRQPGSDPQPRCASLADRYLLGYDPPANKRAWRTIHVDVDRPDATARARKGYYAGD